MKFHIFVDATVIHSIHAIQTSLLLILTRNNSDDEINKMLKMRNETRRVRLFEICISFNFFNMQIALVFVPVEYLIRKRLNNEIVHCTHTHTQHISPFSSQYGQRRRHESADMGFRCKFQSWRLLVSHLNRSFENLP